MRLALLAVLAVQLACGRTKRPAPADAGIVIAPAVAAPAAPPKATTRGVAGIGAIPPWSADQAVADKCTPSPPAKAKLRAVERGDDPALVSGSADLEALVKEVGADGCFATRRALAEALNNGGYKRYGKNRFDEASRFWRAALVVRPGFLLARYNLACGLGRAGLGRDAVSQIVEIARAATEGDAGAATFLEKAKTDDDLKGVRDDPGLQPTFEAALRASHGGLVGPRRGSSEPELGAKILPLLPGDFTERGTYKPAVVSLWTWRPESATELVVTTLSHDAATAGKPGADSGAGYGAIAVFRRDGEKLELLVARKTGGIPPAVAAGRGRTVVYTFDEACGARAGTLTFVGGEVTFKEDGCRAP